MKVRTLRWWLKYAWGIKVGLVVFVTGVLLLAAALAGYLFYRGEVNKISDRFMRLQVFGPREILAFHADTDADAFRSRFHIETRSPAGNALPGAEVKLQFMHPDGTVFYNYTEKTDSRGFLSMPLPREENFPPRMMFRVTATHGKKTETCEGTLDVRGLPPRVFSPVEELPLAEVEEAFFARDDDAVREYESRFGPVFAKISPVGEQPGSFLLNHERPAADVRGMLEISPEKMLAAAGESLKMRLSAEKKGVPVVVGVWNRDFLVNFRPCVLDERQREVEIPVPERFCGLLAVTVHDYRKSPPELTACRFFYRHAAEAGPAEGVSQDARESQDLLLDAIYARIAEMETRRKAERGALLEFLSPELTENAGVAEDAAASEEDAQTLRAQERFHALSRLLLSVVDWNAGKWEDGENREIGKNALPPETLHELESLLAGILTAEIAEEWESEAKIRLACAALNLQSEVFVKNVRETAPDARAQTLRWRQYPPLAHAPLTYDGMTRLQSAYSKDLHDFQQRVVRGMGGIACIILCLACGLMLLVVMLAILKIPVGRNVWLATLAVVVCAVILAWGILARSDLSGDTRNVIFQTWTATE